MRSCRIVATMQGFYIPNRKKSLARSEKYVVMSSRRRGETTMGALRQRAFEREQTFAFRNPTREIPPAEYSDEVTEAQLEAARKVVGTEFEDWDIVDGPAW